MKRQIRPVQRTLVPYKTIVAVSVSLSRVRVLALAAALLVSACAPTTPGSPSTSASTAPSARSAAQMVYDSARGTVLMFGGGPFEATATAPLSNELWSWDGSSWRRLAADGPSPRRDAFFVFDSARERAVLFGGVTKFSPTTVASDTWEWDGSAWKQVATTGPSGRQIAGGGYDAQRRRVVLYGGSGTDHFATTTDTWEWDGASWARRATTGAGPLQVPGPAVFSESRKALVMLVGDFSSGPTQFWQWDGTSWANTGNGPSASMPNNVAGSGTEITIFDGESGKTLRWDGQTSTTVATTGPGKRFFAAFAYDGKRKQYVLFGGTPDGKVDLADTWLFDGRAWTKAK